MKQYVTNTNDGVNVRISLLDDVQDWNHPCSLYELENDGSLYYLPGHPCEVIGKGPFKVKREERFKTFWDIVKEYNVSVQDQRTGQPVSVMINSEDHMDPKLLSERKVLREGGFYDKDGIWNSIVKIDGELYRGRVETLVFRDGSLYIQLVNKKENDNGTKYRIPGGSLERGVPNQEQAHAECMEEARLLIKNCKFSGVTYNEITGMPKWAKAIDPPVEWVGKHTEVYYAEFDKLYTGYIKKKDREEAMLRDGKFLPIEDVYNILIPEHQKVVDMYIGNKYGSISQESKDFGESYVSESFDSKAYNDYMMNGTSDYLERSYKSMNYTFIPIIGLPAFINVDDLEDTVDEIGRDVLDKYWKHNKGTKANVYQPFKCYNTLHLKNDDLMNYIYNDANPLERLKIKLYHYNFSRQGRRYSILLITVKNQLKSIYFITNTGELQPIDSAIRESSMYHGESSVQGKIVNENSNATEKKVLNFVYKDNIKFLDKFDRNKDFIIKKGYYANRVSDNNKEITNTHKRVYVTLSKLDHLLYIDSIQDGGLHVRYTEYAPDGYSIRYIINKDLKFPSYHTLIETFIDTVNHYGIEYIASKMDSSSYSKIDFIKEFNSIYYNELNRNSCYCRFIGQIADDTQYSQYFIDALIDKGYSAIIDENDYEFGKGFTKSPIIILDRTSYLRKVSDTVITREILDYASSVTIADMKNAEKTISFGDRIIDCSKEYKALFGDGDKYVLEGVTDFEVSSKDGTGYIVVESGSESYYRITYEDIGIYEALRNNVTDEEWKSILNSDRIKWLPKPPNYEFNNRSYFTKLGYDTFTKKALPLMKKYLDPKKIKVESFNTLDGDIVYNDEYQVVIATSVTESYVSEGFINQLVMSAPVKAYNIKNKTPINNMSDLIKYHKNPGLINYVNKCDNIDDLKYIKEDTNTITPSVKIIKERITLCKQMGDCSKTASYYKFIKRKYIDAGITEKDCDATIQWVKDFNKVINIKVGRLGNDTPSKECADLSPNNFIGAIVCENDTDDFDDFLHKSYITESEWKSKYRNKFVSTYKTIINRLRNFDKTLPNDKIIDYPDKDPKDWNSAPLIKFMDDYEGGPNDRASGICTKALIVCEYNEKQAPFFKRDAIESKLTDTIERCIPPDLRDRKNKMYFWIHKSGNKYTLMANSIIMHE